MVNIGKTLSFVPSWPIRMTDTGGSKTVDMSENPFPNTANGKSPHVDFKEMNSAKILENNIGDMAVEKERKPSMPSALRSNGVQLVICFLGIFVSYFIYGILQEKITKSTYGEEEEKFTFTLALVFFQCIVNGLFAEMGIWYFNPGRDTAPQTMYAAMSFSYLGAMLASNHALQFISYPTQVLGKSVKPIPVMILGVLYAKKRYPLQKYLFVLLIVVGVAMFTYKDKKGGLDTDHTWGWGEVLLLVSLTLDGMTGAIQDKIRSHYQTQTYRMMLYINLWSLLYLSAALLVTGEGMEFLSFASRYPGILLSLLSFSVLSALGQIFIFKTVTQFGPLTCSIMTTTRKFFTILGSVIIFAHPMSSRQWAGTVLVFAGLSLDSAYGREKRLVAKD